MQEIQIMKRIFLVCIFLLPVLIERTNAAPSDTNSVILRSLEDVNTSIESLRLRIKNIKDSVDIAISETKERNARYNKNIMANDPNLLEAERKATFVREVLEELRKNPPDARARSQYRIINNKEDSSLRAYIDINRPDNTLTAVKEQRNGTIVVTFRYPFKSSPLKQAMEDVRKIKDEYTGPQVKELQELTVVQNSVGAFYQSIARIRRMRDANSVNFEQVKQEIENLDKKTSDTELTVRSELRRISEKYQRNNSTKDESGAPQLKNKADESADPAARIRH